MRVVLYFFPMPINEVFILQNRAFIFSLFHVRIGNEVFLIKKN